MTWINKEERLPKQGQWVVVVWGDEFKAGKFDGKHPFSPLIMEPSTGKWFRNFTHWKPLRMPTALNQA